MAVKIAVIWLSQNKKAHTPSMTDGVEVSDQSIIKKIYTGRCQSLCHWSTDIGGDSQSDSAVPLLQVLYFQSAASDLGGKLKLS